MLKLNIGCANWVEEGWIGIDRNAPTNPNILKLDVRDRLPYKENSVDLIFCEDFIEHLTRTEGLAFLKECFRVLKPTSTLRVSTPDLKLQATRYLRGTDFLTPSLLDFNQQQTDYDWATAVPGTYQITFPCEQMNILFSWWGHCWVYDEEYLTQGLLHTGFVSIHRCVVSKSNIPELCGMDRRIQEDQLIIEGTKP